MDTTKNPVTYAAYWNTPGYLPESDIAYFDTAAQAWNYLIDERDRALLEAEDMGPDYDHTMGEMYGRLVAGTVIGPTPGYHGTHDLGVAYNVDLIEGVVCVDCGRTFATEDLADAHWGAEHDH